LAERYDNPTVAELSTIKKLTTAFEMAKNAKIGSTVTTDSPPQPTAAAG
jgi:hypothetical protein